MLCSKLDSATPPPPSIFFLFTLNFSKNLLTCNTTCNVREHVFYNTCIFNDSNCLQNF